MPLSFKFPITKADGSEFKSAKELLGQLSGESAGLYLLSTNAFWHGGLHISDDTSGYVADKRPVRAMATGEVVAYRLNDDYCTSTWGEAADKQTLKYSSSFCLVRHAYASPHKRPDAPATPATTAAADQGPQNTLVFYSLYMHLQPYAGYAQRVVVRGASALAYTQFPGTVDSASTSAASGPSSAGSDTASSATLYGLQPVAAPIPLLTGTELSVLDETEWVSGNQVTKLLYVAVSTVPTSSDATPIDPDSPSSTPAVTVAQHYWVATNGSQLSTVNVAAARKRPAYWKSSRRIIGTLIRPLAALRDPSGQSAGATIHAIPAGTKVEIEREQLLKQGGKKKPFAQVKVVSLGEGDAGSVAPGDIVWVSSAEGDLAREPVIPDPFNSVVICDPPLPIEAGATIGYLGLYETPGPGDEGKTSRQQVHVEIFTGDPKFDDFFANAAGLTEGKKYKMAGTDGAPARASTSSGVNTFAPGTDPLLLPVAVDTTASLAKQDSLHKKWFPVEGIADSGVLNGWVPEGRLKDVVQYDWEKLGFRKVEEANDNADGFMDPEKMPEFFKTIYKLIHKSTNGEVTPDELIAANHNSAVRNALAHVVARHPSEWQGKADAAKWNVIKENEALLKNDPKRLNHELERIDALSWWDDIRDIKDFPASPNVWHFNPVMFVDAIRKNDLITMEMLEIADPNGSRQYHEEILPYLNKYAEVYEVNTRLRICHFLAQVGTESGFKVRSEDGYYSATNMRKTFGCKGGKKNYDASCDDCVHGRLSNRTKLWSESASYAGSPEKLFSYVYSSRMGNGNEDSGDGYKYRGRGIIQLTGKDNYKKYNEIHNSINPDDKQDFVANPDLIVNDIKYGIESAFIYCDMNSFNAAADRDNVIETTQIVNGGQNGIADRIARLNRLKEKIN
ncbi:glycoside hydrolase family 19 protein [Caballeronia sp. KNU42]